MKRTLLIAAAALMLTAGAASAATLTVTSSGNLNMRSGPGTANAVVMQLPRGTQVETLSQRGTWVEVRSPSGATGWVSAGYLGKADTRQTTGRETQPQTRHQRDDSPRRETAAQQPARQTQPQGIQNRPQDNAGTHARHVQANVGSLNMRSGPGTGYGVTRSLPAGTDVTVLETRGDWLRIQISSGTIGWVASAFIGN